MSTVTEPKAMTDWYFQIKSDGKKQAFRKGIVGGFQMDIRMNDDDTSAFGVQVEGVKKEDGTLELTFITADDERYLVRTTRSGNPEIAKAA